MAKQDAKTAIPRLRFPEFQDTKPWGTEKLSILANRVTVKNVDGKITRVLTNSAEFGVLDQRDYFDKDIATAGKTDGYYVVEKGDYVYNPRISALAPVGPISRNDVGEGVMSPLYTVFRFSERQSDFYRHYFYSTGWHTYLRSAASTGARHDRMSITNDAFMRMPVPVPVSAEQHKIADCLMSLDEVIAAQGRKVGALKAHKRGLMQQLFPREGETRPRLRFPEFHAAPAWKPKKLSALIELVSGMHLSPDQYSSSGDTPYFTGPSDFTNDLEDVEKWTARSSSVAMLHDTLITVKGSGVGECWYLRMPFVAMGRQLMAVRSKASSSQFIHQFLLTKKMRFEDLAGGNLIPGLSRGDILGLIAAFPQKDEQQRIADCLTSLDSRISAEAARLAALKTHKQGLMQQLFPTPEAAGA